MTRLHGTKSVDPMLAQMIAEQVFDNALVAAGLMDDSRVMLPRWVWIVVYVTWWIRPAGRGGGSCFVYHKWNQISVAFHLKWACSGMATPKNWRDRPLPSANCKAFFSDGPFFISTASPGFVFALTGTRWKILYKIQTRLRYCLMLPWVLHSVALIYIDRTTSVFVVVHLPPHTS